MGPHGGLLPDPPGISRSQGFAGLGPSPTCWTVFLVSSSQCDGVSTLTIGLAYLSALPWFSYTKKGDPSIFGLRSSQLTFPIRFPRQTRFDPGCTNEDSPHTSR